MPRLADIRTDRGTSAASGAGDLAAVGAVPAAFSATPSPAPGDIPFHAAAGAAHIVGAPQVAGHSLSGMDANPNLLATTSPGALSATQSATPAQQIMVPVIIAGMPTVSADETIALAAAVNTSGQPIAGEAAAVAVVPTADGGDPDFAATTITAPTLDEMRETLATLQATVAQLAGDLGGTMGNTTGALAGIDAAVHEDAGSAPDRVAAALDGTADHAASLTAPLLDGISQSVDTALEGAAGIVDTGVAQAAATVDQAVAATSHAVQGVTGLAEDILAETPLSEGIAGADPVAGVATLVGMVSAADAFGLHDAGDAGEILSPPLGMMGAADLLADVAPADALLGLDGHDGLLGGLLGGLADPGDHGLFGHG